MSVVRRLEQVAAQHTCQRTPNLPASACMLQRTIVHDPTSPCIAVRVATLLDTRLLQRVERPGDSRR